MKPYVKIIILALVFALFIGGAVVLYNRLAEDYDPYADHAESVETEGAKETNNETDVVNTELVETEETDIPETEPVVTETEIETETAELQIPDFTVYNADGEQVHLSDFVGKPIIVNFWATWCGPCKNEMPYFQNMYDKYGDEVAFLMVNATDGARDTVKSVKEFIENKGYTFPVYFDTEYNAIDTYGVYAYPSTLAIYADGTIYAGHVGALTQSQLESVINKLLLKNK